MKVRLTTGMGYVKQAGVITYKFNLPIGEHEFPADAIVFEVSKAELDAITIAKTQAETKTEILSWLDGRYEQIIIKLVRQYLEGYGDGDNTSLATVKALAKDSKTKYNAKKAAIEAGAQSVTDDFQV